MICGISIVRNEIDIIEFCIWHHLNQGLSKIIVCDNGSTDGTLETLTRMAKEDDRIVLISDDGPFYQEEIMNQLYRTAQKLSCQWVVFFDADEIWQSENGIANDLSNVGEQYVAVAIENFVQNRTYNINNIYKNIKWKIESYSVSSDDIFSGVRSTIEYRWSNKFIFRADPNIWIGPGAHYFKYISSNQTVVARTDVSSIFKCYQVPIRSYEHLIRKAEHGIRLKEAGYGPIHGWECQRLGEILISGEKNLKREWRHNSSKSGFVQRPDSSSIKLVLDNYIYKRYKEYLRYKNGNI